MKALWRIAVFLLIADCLFGQTGPATRPLVRRLEQAPKEGSIIVSDSNRDGQWDSTLIWTGVYLIANGDTLGIGSGGGVPQSLTFTSPTLSISGGNSVDLSALLDNTDDQVLSLTGDVLSLEDGGSVNLSSYLDNTDTQDLSLAGNTLSLTDGGSVDLSAFLDNTDSQTLSLAGTVLSISGGNNVDFASLVAPQNLTFDISTGNLSISGGNTVTIPEMVGASSVAAGEQGLVPVPLAGDEEKFLRGDGSWSDVAGNQTISITGTDLSISQGNSVALAEVLALNDLSNVNASPANGQVLSWNGSQWVAADDATGAPGTSDGVVDGVSISNDSLVLTRTESLGDLRVDLDPFLDNTDEQTLSLAGTDLSVSGGNTVDLSGLQDGTGTDDQQLTLTGNTLSLEDGGPDIDLSGYIDNTDNQGFDIASLNGTDLELSLDNDAATTIIDLSSLQDGTGTDDQQLSLAGNSLSLEDGGSVSLASYLDNTDEQTLSFTSPNLSVSGGNTVDLSALQDGTGTDDQALSLAGTTVSLEDGGSVDLTEVLALNDLSNVNSSPTNGQVLSWNGSAWVAADDATGAPGTSDGVVDGVSISNDSLVLTRTESLGDLRVDLDPFLDNTDEQQLSLTGNSLTLEDGGSAIDLSGYLDNTDAQTLSLVSTNLTISNGNTVDLSALQDGIGTDDQTLSFTSPNLSISGGNSVNLSALLDNTDDQTIDVFLLSGDDLQLSLEGDGEATKTVDLSGYLDNTDTQDLSLAGNTLSLTDGGSVDLSLYLDDTDDQTLSFTSPNLSISGGNSVNLSALNTERTDEEIEDVAGAMFSGNAETLITATYQDVDGTIDLEVNDDLSLYDNSTSGFVDGTELADTAAAIRADFPTTADGVASSGSLDTLSEEIDIVVTDAPDFSIDLSKIDVLPSFLSWDKDVANEGRLSTANLFGDGAITSNTQGALAIKFPAGFGLNTMVTSASNGGEIEFEVDTSEVATLSALTDSLSNIGSTTVSEGDLIDIVNVGDDYQVDVDLSELTNSAADIIDDDEFIFLDNGNQQKMRSDSFAWNYLTEVISTSESGSFFKEFNNSVFATNIVSLTGSATTHDALVSMGRGQHAIGIRFIITNDGSADKTVDFGTLYHWAGTTNDVELEVDVGDTEVIECYRLTPTGSVFECVYLNDTIPTGGGGSDDWGTQVVQSDATLIGDGTSGNELKVDTSEVATLSALNDSIAGLSTTDTHLFSENKTLSANRSHSLGANRLGFTLANGEFDVTMQTGASSIALGGEGVSETRIGSTSIWGDSIMISANELHLQGFDSIVVSESKMKYDASAPTSFSGTDIPSVDWIEANIPGTDAVGINELDISLTDLDLEQDEFFLLRDGSNLEEVSFDNLVDKEIQALPFTTTTSGNFSIIITESVFGVVRVNLTGGATTHTVTMSTSFVRTGAQWTIHIRNTGTGTHTVDFPSTVLKGDATTQVGNIGIDAGDFIFIPMYYDGTNFITNLN